MSRFSLVVGILISIGLHVLLFLPVKGGASEAHPVKVRPVTLLSAPARPAVAAKPPAAKPVVKSKPKPKPKTTASLAKVVSPPPVRDKPAKVGNTASKSPDSDDLPSLRIVWESASQLRQVADALGLKVVAVNDGGEILGEVARSGPLVTMRFTDRLARFSNRVRTLPTSFFGSVLQLPSGTVALWVLVPAGVDKGLLAIQRKAIADRGLAVSGVRVIEGEFRQSNGKFELFITRIVNS